MKIYNKLFGFALFSFLLTLFYAGIFLVLMFPAMAYEDGTSTGGFGKFAYTVAGVVTFLGRMFSEIIDYPSIIGVPLSCLIDAFITLSIVQIILRFNNKTI